MQKENRLDSLPYFAPFKRSQKLVSSNMISSVDPLLYSLVGQRKIDEDLDCGMQYIELKIELVGELCPPERVA